MVAYGDLSDSARRVLKLTIVYPHMTSRISGVMMKDAWSPSDNNRRDFVKGRKELEMAGLIKIKQGKDGHDRILTHLAYQIIPKEVLIDLLTEMREAFLSHENETSSDQVGTDELIEIKEILLRIEKNVTD